MIAINSSTTMCNAVTTYKTYLGCCVEQEFGIGVFVLISAKTINSKSKSK